MLLSVAIAAAGIWLAYRWYIQQPKCRTRSRPIFGGLYRLPLQQVLRSINLLCDVRESDKGPGAHAGSL